MIKDVTYFFFGIALLFTIKYSYQDPGNKNGLPFNGNYNKHTGDTTFSINRNGKMLKIPYYSNVKSLNTKNESITRAVVSVHGASRNADDYYTNMLTAAEMESTQMDTLLIVAPQFLIKSEIEKLRLNGEHLYWSSGGWKIGNLSKDQGPDSSYGRISSFTMLDSLLSRLVKNNPNLKTIVVSGHSAGGQFVNRYAAASPVPTSIEKMEITVRFVVNNPSSYLYLDDTRKVPDTDHFQTPITECTEYNEYKYGLDDVPNYLIKVGVDQIRNQFKEREVVYLLGEDDNDLNSSSLDRSCGGNLQGSHRFERGITYYKYLQSYYGPHIKNKHVIGIISNVGHSHKEMFQSELGRYYTFLK